jgi:hypothetical protein
VGTAVYYEVGSKRVFAGAVDWPGWGRFGKDEESALDALLAYEPRYAAAVPLHVRGGAPHVVGRVRGGASTDFGAPEAYAPGDEEPVDGVEAGRLADVLAACWGAFDAAVARAPAELPKGPRGGGRDRDQIVDHVREAERSYGRKLGPRVPPRTPWDEQRAVLLDAVRAGAPDGAWPVRYAVRRFAWHVLDHAWEVEDKS